MNRSVLSQFSRSYPLTGQEVAKQQTAEALTKVIGDSQDVLFRATTVFPLTIFPDTLTIDRTKFTITHRLFMGAGETLSIRIEDVLNVTADLGPFFGKIKIATRFFDPGKPYEIDHFWRKDALKIKRIAQGYMTAKQKNIDCSALSTEELTRTLDELGKVSKEDTL